MACIIKGSNGLYGFVHDRFKMGYIKGAWSGIIKGSNGLYSLKGSDGFVS